VKKGEFSMVKITCDGMCAKDCFECGKYFSANSSHYDSYYNCNVIEISCCIGGNRTFKDENGDTHRLS
jgi:hypothetical protein